MRNGRKFFEKDQGLKNIEYGAIQALQNAFPLEHV